MKLFPGLVLACLAMGLSWGVGAEEKPALPRTAKQPPAVLATGGKSAAKAEVPPTGSPVANPFPSMVPGGNEGNMTQALLEPVQESTLSSQIAARILEIPLDEGSSFKKGDLLVRFDCAVEEARVRKATAVLSGVRKQHDVNLRMQKLDSASELDVALSKAKVEEAEADLNETKVQVERCVVLAPYDGKVVKRHVSPFDSVGKEGKLLEILANGPLKVRLYVPSAWSQWLKEGISFQVSVEDTAKNYDAKVVAVGSRVDAASQTLAVRGEIQGTFPQLLAGMTGMARFAQ